MNNFIKQVVGSYVVEVDDKRILFVNKDFSGKMFNGIDEIKNIIGPKEILDKYFNKQENNLIYVDDFLKKNKFKKLEIV